MHEAATEIRVFSAKTREAGTSSPGRETRQNPYFMRASSGASGDDTAHETAGRLRRRAKSRVREAWTRTLEFTRWKKDRSANGTSAKDVAIVMDLHELVIRRKHPVVAMPVLPRRRDEIGEPVEEHKA